MGEERKAVRERLRASQKHSFRVSEKPREAKETPDEIQPVDREGTALKAGDLLTSNIMGEPEPIAFVRSVFPDGSYEMGWLNDRVSAHGGAHRIISREAQPTMMWVKVDE